MCCRSIKIFTFFYCITLNYRSINQIKRRNTFIVTSVNIYIFFICRVLKKEIYNIINQMAADGVAVIMVSSELPEVLGMSDRIAVVHEGKITGILDAAEAEQAKVMTLATGGSL